MAEPGWIGGEWVARDLPAGAPSPALPALALRAALAASGRAAIAAALRAIGARRVLLPAYGCPALTQAVHLAGATAHHHPGDKQMRPLWSEVAALARRHGADTLLLVHPLGILQDAAELRRAAIGLRVIEDASHSLANAPGWAALGPGVTTALAASLRKVLPLPCGGLWTTWDGSRSAQGPAAPSAFGSARAAAFAQPTGWGRHRALSRAEAILDADPGQGPDPKVLVDLQALPSAPAGEWLRRCRANWEQLRSGLASSPCRPLWSALPTGSCPVGFVLRCPDRTRLARFLLARRIEAVLHWPVEPAARPVLTREERMLAGTVLTLPCDGRYGPEDMDHILRAVNDFSRIR